MLPMTEKQRQQRAAFVREQPFFWLFILYTTTFWGCSVASEAFQPEPSRMQAYLMPFPIALGMWVGLRGWARRMGAGPQDDSQA